MCHAQGRAPEHVRETQPSGKRGLNQRRISVKRQHKKSHPPPQLATIPPCALLLKFSAKFLLLFFLSTIACTWIWSYCITDVLYHCTDSLPGDYLSGSFVHGKIAGAFAYTGDTIAPGWTLPKLYALWYTFITASLLLSITLALPRWTPKPKPLEYLPGGD